MLESINKTLIDVGSGGDPSEAPLVLPRFDKMPTCPQLVPGWGDDGVFISATLGAACLIDKTGTDGVIKTDNSEAKVIFNPGGSSRRETNEVPGLHQTHCSFKPREGGPKKQFKFTPYKFELTDFLVEGSGVYLVINMHRTWSTPPKADTEEQGAAATGFSPPAWTAARVTSAVVSQPSTGVAVPELATKVDEPSTTTDAPPGTFGAAEITPDDFSEEVKGLVERFSGASISCDGGAGAGEGGGGAAASGRCAAVPSSAEGGAMLARGARCEISGLVGAPQHNGKRCSFMEFHEAKGRWQVSEP